MTRKKPPSNFVPVLIGVVIAVALTIGTAAIIVAALDAAEEIR